MGVVCVWRSRGRCRGRVLLNVVFAFVRVAIFFSMSFPTLRCQLLALFFSFLCIVQRSFGRTLAGVTSSRRGHERVCILQAGKMSSAALIATRSGAPPKVVGPVWHYQIYSYPLARRSARQRNFEYVQYLCYQNTFHLYKIWRRPLRRFTATR